MWRRNRALLLTALRGIMTHKLRSGLTMLGLVFGVSSVIIMLAVTEGAGQQAQRQISALGINNVIVRSVKPVDTGDVRHRQFEASYGLTYNDLRRIKDSLTSVVRVTPLREFSRQARYGDKCMEVRLVGVHPNYFESNRISIGQGRQLDAVDLEKQSNVCVIGEEIASKLFAGKSPLGKSVGVGNENFFRIVGVQDYKAPSAGVGSSLSGQNLNQDIVIPLTSNRSRLGDIVVTQEQGTFSAVRLELSQITVEVSDRHQVKPAAAALQGLLSKFHPHPDFSITVPLDLLEQAQATQRIFNFVLAATAAISLLVGGIGIMNIMLATVSERTGEIGIRRALGAKQFDIIVQFLAETASLSVMGTLLGIGLGIGAPSLVTAWSGMETVVTLKAIIIAATVSFIVGLVFGIYPAYQAAKLDPIEALRRL
jgi:putative ABC transport system permease protein